MGLPHWDKEADRLHEAVQGLGSDEVSIVRVLARFTNKQRHRLLKEYRERFHEVRKTLISWPFLLSTKTAHSLYFLDAKN